MVRVRDGDQRGRALAQTPSEEFGHAPFGDDGPRVRAGGHHASPVLERVDDP